MSDTQQHQLIALAREAGQLFVKLSHALDNWASSAEQRLHAAPTPAATAADCSLSNASSGSAAAAAATAATAATAPRARASELERAVQHMSRARAHDYDDDELPQNIRPRKKRRDALVAHAAEQIALQQQQQQQQQQVLHKQQQPRVHAPKSSKRLRVNWSEEENDILFRTLERFASFAEEDVVREIVHALGGSRTRFQTKGRFRNLLASGKIRSSGTNPSKWVVDHDKKIRARKSSLGTDRANLRSGHHSDDADHSVASSRDSPRHTSHSSYLSE